MNVYDLNIGEGGMWGWGELEFTQYSDISKFIDAAEFWLPADGGVFYKRSKYKGYSNKYTAKTWPAVMDKELEEGLDYANITDHPEKAEPIRKYFAEIAELVKQRGYMVVPYGVEYTSSYLVIHKDDWSVLRNTKIKYDRDLDERVVVR